MAMRQDASTGQMVSDGQPEAVNTEPQFVDGKPIMGLRIYSPFKVYYDDTAFSVSAQNATGPFDILPQHHNFISLLSACEVHVIAPSGEKRIRISGGLMHVKADQVRIFLDV